MLNAFRHHREEHPLASGHAARGCAGAQRLAASPGGARGHHPAAAGALPRVLNALRHHREEHRPARPSRGLHGRAQRLAASPGGALRRPSPVRVGRARAQRLAASPGGAPGTVGADTSTALCSTPCGITGRSTRRRHTSVSMWAKCSTPCGITGRSTPSDRRRAAPLRVLNALRHHREEHSTCSSACSPRLWRAQRLAASPGGARGAGVAVPLDQGGCSTPCGITGRSTLAGRVDGAHALVLNALRHHREEHRPAQRVGRPCAPCAQRLAASPGGAPPRTWPGTRCHGRAQRLAASPGGARGRRE